ncbi:GntR family transcriptional regulator [Micromonospora sp. NBC_01638]|uniref:GntR family transcriptional regulator n=1 Tax=Micromonospora sp. NBC_01638 TaxID=2975982 RepID=UPI00386B9840|nr:GntR family transcriptional regulator [Micromonospora sp. NBC_01638]
MLLGDQLRERIESGSIPPGALLPTESALTSEFRASRGDGEGVAAVMQVAAAWAMLARPARRSQDQNHQQRVPTTPQPVRVRHLPQPVEQRSRHGQRVNPTRVHREFGLPQAQIGEVVNNRADRGG